MIMTLKRKESSELLRGCTISAEVVSFWLFFIPGDIYPRQFHPLSPPPPRFKQIANDNHLNLLENQFQLVFKSFEHITHWCFI